MTESGETIPVLGFDNAMPGATRLVDDARRRAFSRNARYYPGVRAPAPAGYPEALAGALAEPVAAMMGWPEGTPIKAVASDYSLVTQPPETLHLLQRLPHYDGMADDVVAVLHYLCGEEHGGTSFYRHRSTGFARVTEARREAYDLALKADIEHYGPPPPAYLDQASTSAEPVFARIATHDCRFNRIIAYPANSLHCGRIPANHPLSDDPAVGRLTVNTFVRRA